MALIMHVALRWSFLKDARYSSSKTKNKDQALQQLHLNGLELTRNCKNFLSWAGELFIIPHVHKTSKDATPPLQGKRKRVQVHESKKGESDA
jgi:hypothetical protein